MASRQIAQSRPSGTSAASFVSNARPWTCELIVITNTGSSAAKYSIYHDADGTTYSTATAIAYQIQINTGEMHTIEVPIRNDDRTGNLAVQTDTANAITFTAYGEIEGEAR